MIRCKNCGKENDSKLWRCETCNELLHEQTQAQRKKPKTYLALSILLILCCIPTAIVSCYYGLKVNSSFLAGEYLKADEHSQRARLWVWISFGLSMVLTVLFMRYVLSMYNQIDPAVINQMQDLLKE